MPSLSDALLAADAAEQDASWRRADALLRDSLLPEQYDSYRGRGYIEVPSKQISGRVYRIDGWRPVGVWEHGEFVGAVCIRPRGNMPDPDVVLARKLMIDGAESEFLRAGNWLSPAWRPAGVAPTVLLLVVLVSPWLLQLRTFGPVGIAAAVALLSLPSLLLWVRSKRRRRAASVRQPGGCA